MVTAEAGATVVGLEPSCLLAFRDEAPRVLPDWSEAEVAAITSHALSALGLAPAHPLVVLGLRAREHGVGAPVHQVDRPAGQPVGGCTSVEHESGE